MLRSFPSSTRHFYRTTFSAVWTEGLSHPRIYVKLFVMAGIRSTRIVENQQHHLPALLPSLLSEQRHASSDSSSSSLNTGRWMKEEHEAFLQGVALYDRDWDLIATIVTTRSVLQIRTHGQKYFAKLEKGKVFPEQVYLLQSTLARHTGHQVCPDIPLRWLGWLVRCGERSERESHGFGTKIPACSHSLASSYLIALEF